jgi:Aspartokinases
MALIVQKFGGTSLADPASRELLASKVKTALEAGDRLILVVSAMGRRGDPYATDTLLDLLNQYPGGADGLGRDLIASCGEVISACLIAALLNSRGIKAQPMTASSAGISATGDFLDANPGDIETSRLRKVLDEGAVPVVTGFQGMDGSGRVLTLGRGGSDTSAVAIAGALGADFVDIYKDVPGVAKADPRLIPQAPFMDFFGLRFHGQAGPARRKGPARQIGGPRQETGHTDTGTLHLRRRARHPHRTLGHRTPSSGIFGLIQFTQAGGGNETGGRIRRRRGWYKNTPCLEGSREMAKRGLGIANRFEGCRCGCIFMLSRVYADFRLRFVRRARLLNNSIISISHEGLCMLLWDFFHSPRYRNR